MLTRLADGFGQKSTLHKICDSPHKFGSPVQFLDSATHIFILFLVILTFYTLKVKSELSDIFFHLSIYYIKGFSFRQRAFHFFRKFRRSYKKLYIGKGID